MQFDSSSCSIWFVMGVVCYLLDIPSKLPSLTLKNAYNVVYIMINESESLQKKLDAINKLLASSGERENFDDFEVPRPGAGDENSDR